MALAGALGIDAFETRGVFDLVTCCPLPLRALSSGRPTRELEILDGPRPRVPHANGPARVEAREEHTLPRSAQATCI